LIKKANEKYLGKEIVASSAGNWHRILRSTRARFHTLIQKGSNGYNSSDAPVAAGVPVRCMAPCMCARCNAKRTDQTKREPLLTTHSCTHARSTPLYLVLGLIDPHRSQPPKRRFIGEPPTPPTRPSARLE
jgi:hypothetical protein